MEQGFGYEEVDESGKMQEREFMQDNEFVWRRSTEGAARTSFGRHTSLQWYAPLHSAFYEFQGCLISGSSALFVASYLLMFFAYWPFGQPIGHWGVLAMMSAVFQTIGIITFSLLDVDFNIYVNRKQNVLWGLLVFLALLILVFALSPVFNTTHEQLAHWAYITSMFLMLSVEIVPIYVLFRFKQIVEMRPGFMKATDVILVLIIFTQVATTAIPLLSSIPPGSQWTRGVSIVVFVCGALTGILQVVLHSWAWQAKSETIRLMMGLYFYLFTQGVGFLAVFSLMRSCGVYVPLLQWLVIPIFLGPTLAIGCFRKALHARLGAWWIQRRTRDAVVDPGIDCDRGNRTEVEDALKRGANLNDYVVYTNEDAYTLLFLACSNDHLDAVQMLLAAPGGVEVDKGSELHGWSPLYVSSWQGQLECTAMLLEHGADANLPSAEGISPLFIASAKGFNRVVAQLKKSGATDTGAQWMEMTAEEIAKPNPNPKWYRENHTKGGSTDAADGGSSVGGTDAAGGGSSGGGGGGSSGLRSGGGGDASGGSGDSGGSGGPPLEASLEKSF
jgi:uncharacterized membrane protein YgcG